MVILTAACDLIYIIIGLLLADSTWALGSRDSDYKSNRFTFIFQTVLVQSQDGSIIRSVKRFAVCKYYTVRSHHLLVRGGLLLLSVGDKRAKRTAGATHRPTGQP